MAAPLIIRDQRDRADQQEIVVTLADFSFTPPEQIFAALRKGGTMSSMNEPRRPPPVRRARRQWRAGAMPAGMAMGAQAGFERRHLRRVSGQRSHPGRSRGGQGRAGWARAAAGHQQLLDERFSRRSRPARWRADRSGRLPGRARHRTPLPDRGGTAAGHPAGAFRAPPRRIPCSRCSKASASKPASSCRPGGARSCAFPTRLARLRPRSRSTWKAACAL